MTFIHHIIYDEKLTVSLFFCAQLNTTLSHLEKTSLRIHMVRKEDSVDENLYTCGSLCIDKYGRYKLINKSLALLVI